MSAAEVHVELLLGRLVRDSAGRGAGRLEEVRVEARGGELRVVEYLTGGLGAAQRIGLSTLAFAALGLLGLPTGGGGYRIPWTQMDLSDPERPRTRCPREQLDRRAE
ncbi:MAG TPA: hypothetical protein VF832_20920 [Longimicrobiales bacterium]